MSNIQNIIAGNKSGGDQRTPVEAPDSLRSTAIARVVDLISEGEIGGLVNGLKSVFLNETPLENSDGSLNFKNVQIDFRSGTPDQSHIPGFPQVENEVGIGVELRHGTDWVRAINNTALSAVRLRLSVNALSKANIENGDVNGHSIAYEIYLKTDGDAEQLVLQTAFTGKTTTRFERSHRIDLPQAATGWQIRVRRTTPNADSATTADITNVDSLAEVIDAKLRYPNSALFGVAVEAEQFQSVPNRAYDCYGRSTVQIPSNYDPETRAYTGIWDGTFKPAWTDNPAWIYRDLVLNERFGLGQWIKPAQLDKWSLYKIAQYCDELVSDGRGGMEPRFTCNLYLQSRQDAFKVLQDITSIFRGMAYWSGNQISCVADMPEDPVYLYTAANVIEGAFAYQGSSKNTRYTVALVTWNDMSDFGRAKIEYVEDAEGILRYGIHQTEIVAVGCTSRAQARRAGLWALLTNRYETDTVTFSVGLDGALAMPGQIIKIADETRAGRRIGGRILAATSDTLTLDLADQVLAGDKISVILPNATIDSKIVATVAGDLITLTSAFAQVPRADAIWVVERPSLEAQRYRVVSVEEKEGLTYAITAVQHVESKFDAIELNAPLIEPDITDLPPRVVAMPQSLAITSRDVAGEIDATKVVTVSWDKVPGAISYEIEWRVNNGGWNREPRTTSTSMDIYGVPPGMFVFRVIAIGLNVSSPPAISPLVEVDVIVTKPGAIVELEGRADQISDDLASEATRLDSLIAAEIDARAAAIAAEAAARQAQADALQVQITEITGSTDAWDSATEYPVDDLVTYGGKLYRALTVNTNKQPDLNPSDWEIVGNYASMDEAIAASLQMSSANAARLDDVGTNSWSIEAAASNLAGIQSAVNHGTTGLSATHGIATNVKSRIDNTGEGKSLETVASDVKTLGTAVNDPTSGLSTRASQSSVTNITNRLNTVPGSGKSIEVIATEHNALKSAVEDANSGLASKAAISTTNSITNRLNTIPGGTGFSLENLATKTSQMESAINHGTTGLATRASASDLTAVTNRLNTVPGGTGFSLETIATKTSQLDSAVNHASTGLSTKASIATTNAISQRLNNTGTNSWTLEQTASNLSAVKIAVEHPTTGLSSRASVTDFTNVTNRLNNISGSGQTLEALRGTVVNLGTSKADVTITNAITASIAEIDSVYGFNRFPGAALATTRGWSILWNSHSDPNWQFGVNLVAGRQIVENGKTVNGVTSYYPGSTPAGRYLSTGSAPFPVEPGKTYIFSRLLAIANCEHLLSWIIYKDAAGNDINTGNEEAGFALGDGQGYIGGTNRSSYYKAVTETTAPTNAVSAIIVNRIYTGATVRTGAYAILSEPMFERKKAGQTQPTPFNYGSSSAWGRWDLNFDINGYISGMSFGNNGITSNFRVRADAFEVVTGAGGTGLALDQTRMDRVFGNAAVYEGDPFGSDSLVMWIGPKSIARVSATKSNGTFWISSTGAQGGGAMIPTGGALPIYMKSNSSTALAVIDAVTQQFARAPGMSRVITATMSSEGANGVRFANNGTGTENFAGSFKVQVSRDGGGWTDVGTAGVLSVPVTRRWTGQETEYSSGRPSQTINVIDSVASGTNLQYRVVETSQLGTPTGWGSTLQHAVSIRVEQQQVVE